jgi:hypothetical protein
VIFLHCLVAIITLWFCDIQLQYICHALDGTRRWNVLWIKPGRSGLALRHLTVSIMHVDDRGYHIGILGSQDGMDSLYIASKVIIVYSSFMKYDTRIIICTTT